MSAPERIGVVAARYLTRLRTRQETHMTATHTIRGACANHPDKPGSVAHPDGTFRCDPCHDEPIVTAWESATGDHTCPCGGPIRTGDRVAVLDTPPQQRVCVECTDAA